MTIEHPEWLHQCLRWLRLAGFVAREGVDAAAGTLAPIATNTDARRIFDAIRKRQGNAS